MPRSWEKTVFMLSEKHVIWKRIDSSRGMLIRLFAFLLSCALDLNLSDRYSSKVSKKNDTQIRNKLETVEVCWFGWLLFQGGVLF